MPSQYYRKSLITLAAVVLTGGLAAGDVSHAATTAPECLSNGMPVPCWQDGWGELDRADGCYYVVEAPRPAADDPVWEGHRVGSGTVYRQRCFGAMGGVLVWRRF
ncbi:hypothetical protein Val02_43990 [Virgisporangium aliadipatigenens]|uniref:Uncharacterized protein n=2 Tax=Virgisporangium aliadipatigenens TaxID=741659 RepID=A0A8J3YPN2_9ACTN|nr:hypothetical protein Val02_43990 [Virgisporangium aliadipatigenens]